MMHYRKGKNVEEELTLDKVPIDNLPKDLLWMKVNGGTKLSNVVDYAVKAVKSGEYRSVLWTGSGGGGISKTVSCAEIMKRDFEMHQITRVKYSLTEEDWDPQTDGLDPIVVKRYIPTICIFLTLDDTDAKQLGYQSSKTETGMWLDRPRNGPVAGDKRPSPSGQPGSRGVGKAPPNSNGNRNRQNNGKGGGGGAPNGSGSGGGNRNKRNTNQQGNGASSSKNLNSNVPQG